MYICICRQINDKQFWEAVSEGNDTVESLQARLGISTRCGNCRPFVEQLLEQRPTRSVGGESVPVAT